MMQVMKRARIAQVDGIRSESCVHDAFLSKIEKDRVVDIQHCYN